MTRAVQCPGCGATYRVEASRIPPGGGHLTCPACNRRWKVLADGTAGSDTATIERASLRLPNGSTGASERRPPRPPGSNTGTLERPAARPVGSNTGTLERPGLRPPGGNTGTIERPARPVTCPRCGHHFQSGPEPARRSILIVDDQEFFRNFAVDLLADQYQTHVAKTRDEAIRKAHELAPDLVILDLGLDQGADDGRAILERIERRVPVIIMTGRTDFDLYGEDWRALEALGARELVVKSMTIGDELRAKVARLLES